MWLAFAALVSFSFTVTTVAPAAGPSRSARIVLERTAPGRAEVLTGVDPYYNTRAVVIPTDGRPTADASLELHRLRAGDRVSVSAEAEVTNNLSLGKDDGFDISAPVKVQVALVLSRSRASTRGVVLERRPFALITPQQHHHTFTERLGAILTRAYRHVYLNEIMTARLPGHSGARCVLRNHAVPAPLHAAGVPTQCSVTGEPHYGEISVLVQAPTAPSAAASLRQSAGGVTSAWRRAGTAQPLVAGTHRIAMAVNVGRLGRGDILQATATVGARILARSGRDCLAMLGAQLWLSDTPTDPVTDGQEFDSGTAQNLVGGDATEAMAKSGAIEVAGDHADAWVIAIAWSSNIYRCRWAEPLWFQPTASSLRVDHFADVTSHAQ